MTNFAGANVNAINAAEIEQILIASYGKSFANGSGVYESMSVGIRGPVEHSIKAKSFNDGHARTVANRMYESKTSFEQRQNRLQDFYNAYLIACKSGPISGSVPSVGAQMRALCADGSYLNYTANTSTDPRVPSAAGVIGWDVEYSDSQNDCMIKWNGMYDMTDAEVDKLVSLMGSASAGDTTGGQVLGLVSAGYSRANVYAPGIEYIEIGGVSIGVADNSYSLSIKTVPAPTPDHRNRPVNRKMAIDLKFALHQTDTTALNATRNLAEDTDATIILHKLSGETITLYLGVALSIAERQWGDTKQIIPFEVKGALSRNPNEASPANWDFTTNTLKLDVHPAGLV